MSQLSVGALHPVAATPSPPTTPLVRSSRPEDRSLLHELVQNAGVFSAEEVACAIEIIDSALDKPDDAQGYKLLVAESGEPGQVKLAGYVCYGRTPFTRSGFDLYWLATRPTERRRGVAKSLCATMEEAIRGLGGTHVRVETSGTEGYAAARDFYDRAGYTQMARLPDFYKPGDDLYTFFKSLL